MHKVKAVNKCIRAHAHSFIYYILLPNWNVTSLSPLAIAQLKKWHSNHIGKAISSAGTHSSMPVPPTPCRRCCDALVWPRHVGLEPEKEREVEDGEDGEEKEVVYSEKKSDYNREEGEEEKRWYCSLSVLLVP